MNLIEFFGTVIKPKQTNGKKLWAPCNTSKITENIYAIRDKDVNLFLVKSNNGYIGLDSGYKNSDNVKQGLAQLNIKQTDIHTVFLSHVDLDHAGGVDSRCSNIFPNATVYIGEEETKYLNRKLFRKKVIGIGLASPIQLKDGYKLVYDHKTLAIDGMEITPIFTPGHTMGHMSYIIDNKTIFVGDTLLIGDEGGYCFPNFWNINTAENIKSLVKQYNTAKAGNISLVLTSHSGPCNDIEFAFKNINKYPDWKSKEFTFRKDALENPYKN